MVTQIFGLKTKENCFFVIQIPVTKIIAKTAIWTNFCFWVSPRSYINCSFMFLMQQSHVEWCVLSNLLCNANNFVLLQKMENKDFFSLTQIFRLLFWTLKNAPTYIIKKQWIIASFQCDSKQQTVKYHI